jgi:UDP-hydrolysing UDP-N-acetyl-D-glucosamine 2-epimerase
MSKRRKIAVFTGNRSEYGLQFPVLRAITADPLLEYFLIAGGAHLSQEFGNTIAEIEQDGFKVHAQVRIEGAHGSPAYTPQCIGSGILSVSDILTEVRPQFLLVYGDRFESFSALIAATQMNVAVAHIEGGDYTEGGALDDSVRHAMTKLAHLHFTTNQESSDRVQRLGEEPWRIFNVGLPSLDLAATGCLAGPEELVPEFHFDLSRPILLFCQHSITTEADDLEQQITPSLGALQQLRGEGYQIVITFPNNDDGGRIIIERLQQFCDGKPDVSLVPSLGRRRFHGMLNLIGRVGRGAVLGNSSAGIKETAGFACPTVNIGTRQQGRLRARNVLDVPYETGAIVEAVHRCAFDEQFREICRTCENPYGRGDAGKQIAEVLATIPIDRRLMQKRLVF